MFLGSMVLGLLGLLGMALLGLNHSGSHQAHAHDGGHSHGGQSHGHSHGHSHHAHDHHAHSDHAQPSSAARLLAVVSPRTLFSLALGFGATGLVASKLFRPFPAAILALLGAVILERLVVTPYWNLLMGFASAPADTLDSLVRAKARAVMPFDQSGSGLIQLELDGQVRQVLGTLRSDQRGLEVLTGDAVRVEAIDEYGNCTVSKLV